MTICPLRRADLAIAAVRPIEPGMHLSSIKRPEIEPGAIERAAVTVIHSRDAAPLQVTTSGLRHPEKEAGKGWALLREIDLESLPTLPELLAGEADGRAAPEDVTCFINNIGLGYQFAVVGAIAWRNAREAGRGHDLPTDWFTEDVHP